MRKKPIREEVKFEGVMEKQPDNTITLKEVYTGMIEAKTLINEMQKKNRKTDVKFTWFAFMVIIFEAINFYLNYIIYRQF